MFEKIKLNLTKKRHKKYGYYYLPKYNSKFEFSEGESNLYNEFGEKLDTYFLRDRWLAAYPYRLSRYFLFDRYNFGLKTHFYSHNCMLETMGNPDKKYGFLIESETIVPKHYDIFKKHKGLEKDFDLIFTYSDRILQTVDNARFVPFCAGYWNKNIDENCYKYKTKDISILSSNKIMCDLHKFRYNLAMKCKIIDNVDTFGTFDGGAYVSVDETLKDYRFSICIENDIKPYFFTERLTSAFIAQTIPIYLGATEIDKFFNPDGIIKITTKDNILDVLKQCTKEEYERRLPAILENYNKAKLYAKPFDYMYEKYLK